MSEQPKSIGVPWESLHASVRQVVVCSLREHLSHYEFEEAKGVAETLGMYFFADEVAQAS